jgi:hypothetical protein
MEFACRFRCGGVRRTRGAVVMLPQKHACRLALIALASLALASMSCGGGSPTGPSPSSGPATFLSLVSSPGDQIGNGFTQRVGLSEAIFSAQSYPVYGNRVAVKIGISPKDGTQAWWWTLMLATPPGQPLRTGAYEGARRWGSDGTEAQMDFGGTGRGCSSLTGRFVIDDLALGASDGSYRNIDRLHMTFEQTCDRASAPIRGEISIVANPWR